VHNDFLPDVTNSLERALAMLEAIEQSSAGMTNAEISRKPTSPPARVPISQCGWSGQGIYAEIRKIVNT